MATVLNVTVARRSREEGGHINVVWVPALEEVENFATCAQQFLAPWTEQQISDFGFEVAVQAIFDTIDGLFPGEFEKGTVV